MAAADDEVDCWPVATQQGHAFEVNNNLPHKVQQWRRGLCIGS